MIRKLAISVGVMILLIAVLGYWKTAHAEELYQFKVTDRTVELIYMNETGGNPDALIIKNDKEAVCSLGIGHFIWYPAGVERQYKETFPGLLRKLQKTDGVFKGAPDVVIPSTCPWSTSTDLEAAKGSEVYKRIMMGLTSPVGKRVQIEYMTERARDAIAETIGEDPLAKKKVLDLLATEQGTYAVIDYINFKGNSAVVETYGDFQWGFKTAIHVMSENETLKPEVRFQIAVETLLEMRVEEAKKLGKDEASFLPGWLKRVNTYSDLNTKEGK
jgi:hypothetical protein